MSSTGPGPDRIIPTDLPYTWCRNGAVALKMTKDGLGANTPVSIPTFVKRTCDAAGNKPALAFKKPGDNGRWTKWTYSEYYAFIRCAARSMIKLGLERFSSVAIYGFNGPEWFLAALGAVHAGGFSSGLYPTNGPSVNEYIMNDARCNLLFVEDGAALDKIWPAVEQVPSLKAIVQWGGGKPTKPGVLTWDEFMGIGAKESDDELEERLSDIAVNQCAVLVYTSGTTGNPKGVMLSHDNITWTTNLAVTTHGLHEEQVVSYLPLSHVAAFMLDMMAPIGFKGCVWFADKMALKGTLLDTLKEVRPTVFLGVPRVWEKIMEGMQAKGREVKGLKKKISTACKKAGIKYHLEGKTTPMYTVGKKAIYPKVREALGLDRCKLYFTGAAPMSIEVFKYFMSLDIIVLELYGMSENTGPQTFNTMEERKLGTVGKTVDSCRTKIADADPATGEGEIAMWGRNCMMGYLSQEEKTKKEFDDDYYFRSGDVGVEDEDGFIKITGRIKELIITAGGENVAPSPIEDAIKAELPLISNVVLIGDKQKFLSCFLTLKVNIVDDEPTNELMQVAVEWCAEKGRRHKTVDDILNPPDPLIMKEIQNGIDRANKQAVSNACRVQRWTVLPGDLSIKGGELGPTLKLKRFAFMSKYTDTIDRIYC